MSSNIKYKIYPSLLDSFQYYLDSSENYQKYWGNSADPAMSEADFEEKCLQDLLNSINRVPFESEDADRGTAFNEIVDWLITGAPCEREGMGICFDEDTREYVATYKERIYRFPESICMEFANYYRGAIPQVLCQAVLPTKYGNVLLYGYIDELMSFGIHDIKTTKKYEVGKFRKHWQHRVYPYCIDKMGNCIDHFEYNVAEITKSGKITTFTEYYRYDAKQTESELIEICEWFISFLENNRDKITDKKVFALI